MITDPVADFLTRIRNASSVELDTIVSPYSKLREAIAQILKKEGYIENYEVIEETNQPKQLQIQLAYQYDVGARRIAKIRSIKRISKPGRRTYVNHSNIPRPLRGLGTVIVSTSGGILTGKEASKRRLGGELLCEIC